MRAVGSLVVRCAGLLALWSVSASTTVARNTTCDDGQPQTETIECGYGIPNPEDVFPCSPDTMLALREGCLRCVDVVTCELPDVDNSEAPVLLGVETATNDDDVQVFDTEPGATSPLVPVEGSMSSSGSDSSDDLVPAVPKDPSAEDPMSAMALHANQAVVSGDMPAAFQKPPRPSILYFVVPVLVTLSAFAIAARSRAAEQRHYKVDDDDEEINPFCDDHAEDNDDDDDREYAGGNSDEEERLHPQPPSGV